MFKGIHLRQFRNIQDLAIPFSPGVNIFLGDNGQGKTNLLEALYLLSTGDTFRFADNENLIGFKQSEARLTAKAISNDLDFEIQMQILKSRKGISLNGKRVTAAELSKRFPAVIFSPESLAAIKEGADERRQLVDELVVSLNPRNAELIQDFKKALKTRNRVLKDQMEGSTPFDETERILESLNPTFLRLATQLSHERIVALRAILSDVNEAMKYISKRSNVHISVEYVISGENALEMSLENVQNALKKRLFELHDAELSSGHSLVGPQKHDIVFLYGENDSRFYCSQGQQRALILSFKMAQIVYHRRVHGTYPSLMLDDVLSELDSEKRDELIRFLGDIKTQIFITTTDFNLPSSMKSEDCAVLRVREGAIE